MPRVFRHPTGAHGHDLRRLPQVLVHRRGRPHGARRRAAEVREFRRTLGAASRAKGAPYALKVVPHRIADRPGLASGYVAREAFAGGAHGDATFEAVNYGIVGGRVRSLRLADLFLPGVDAASVASRAIVAAAKEGKIPLSGLRGGWRLSPDRADRFAVGPKGVLFLFDRGEAGAGAEGARTVLVPFGKLKEIDRKGALKPLFA